MTIMPNFVEISNRCAKVLFITMNLMCILLALFTFGFAVVDTKILQQYGEEQAAGSFAGDIIIIAASLLLVFVATFGCVGAARGSVKVLYMYVGFIMILVVLEILIAVYVSIQRYGLQFRVTDWIREEFFANVTGEGREAHKKLWDELQTNYECCGLNGPDDYAAIGKPISVSCCQRAFRARTVQAQQQMYRACVDSVSYYRDGCEDEILNVLQSDADYLLGVAVISFWFEAVCMLLAVWLANHVKNAVHVYKHTVKY